MVYTAPAEAFVPAKLTDKTLREAAATCTACPLYILGTQTVFGEGPSHADIMMVGEQPGDQEDLLGRPFVGPAGKQLDRALKDAGISREKIYLTNVVKHFKWHSQEGRRIHDKPNTYEIKACLPWLKAEIELHKPNILVCMGITAASAILGKKVTIKKERGKFIATHWSNDTYVTIHPASLLRNPDPEEKLKAYQEFVVDLQRIAQHLRHMKLTRAA